MQSEGSQANIGDSDDITETLNSVQDQVKDLLSHTTSLVDQMRSRDGNISQSHSMLDTLESRISEMAAISQELNYALETASQTEDDSSRELDDLIAERDNLQTQIDNCQQPSRQSEVEGQERLLGFLREECYRKMENLCFMKEMLSNVKQDYKDEWAGFKNDLTEHREEKLGYQQEIDHVKDLTLARFIGMHSNAKADSSEKDLIRRISTYRTCELLHRQLEQEIGDSEVKSRDLENEIGDLICQKKTNWKRCLDLENCLDELNGEAEGREISLRPAHAHQDLAHIDDHDWSERRNEEDSEEYVPIRLDFGHTGKILHRCPKQTNIAINESLSNENESQEVSTSVDTGGFDATPQHDPEPEQDPDEQEGQLQMKLPSKAIEKLSPQQQTTTSVAPPAGLEAPEHHEPFISKLRKRVSGLSGSLRGHRSHGKITATGSTKRIDSPKRGRR